MYVEGGVPSIDVDEWVTDLGRDAHAESVRRMRELRVMLPLEDVTGAAGDGESLGLNPKFQRGMRSIMEVRSVHWSPYDRVGVVNADL
jgi:hypothetical protein